MLSKKVFISGHVQGVSFRFHAVAEASKLQLKGWVRNLKDGRVEMLVSGKAESIDKLIQWAHRGPDAAKVEKVEVLDTKEVAAEEFFIKRD